MKKKLYLGVISVAFLVVAGCGADKNDGSYLREEQKQRSAAEGDQYPDEEKEDIKTGKKKDNESDIRKISYSYQNHPLEAAYGEDTFTIGAYYTISLDDDVKEEYPKLAESIDKYNSRTEKDVREFVGGSREEVLSMWEEGFTGYYEDDIYLQPVRSDSKVFSFVEENYIFYGGAHGSTVFSGYNYDPQTGKEIQFDDVVIDTSALPEIIFNELTDQNTDLKAYFDELPSDKDALISGIPDRLEDNAKMLAWALDYDGIRINFEDYAMGSYAAGTQSIKIRFKDHPEIFSEKYNDYNDGSVPDIDDAALKLKDSDKEVLNDGGDKSKKEPEDKDKPLAVNIIEPDRDTRYKMNVFVSNFAEQGLRFYDEEEDRDIAELTEFAYIWMKINKYKDIESEGSYYRISLEKVKSIIEKYFDVKLSNDELYGYDWDKSKYSGFCKGGYYYVPAADGESYTGLAIVEQAEDMGDGTLWLYFTTYDLDLDIYWNSNEGIAKKYYSMNAEEARNSGDLESRYQGMAIVKKAGDTYKLKYYKIY